MKISIGCDHGGLTLKNAVVDWLKSNGYEVVNFGTDTFASCDYPEFAMKAAEAVANGECDFGIVVCTTESPLLPIRSPGFAVRSVRNRSPQR